MDHTPEHICSRRLYAASAAHMNAIVSAMKKRKLNSTEDANQIIDAVTRSAAKAMQQIARLPKEQALRPLWSMKIEQVGCNPLDADAPLNLIEQLNQTFTYVASAKAVKLLLSLHPELAPFTVNSGTMAGPDIESAKAGDLSAEVFAAVNTTNNRKLAKDIEKVGLVEARFKYVFFMCPGYEAGRQTQLETRPDVEVWSVGDSL
jgi:hypothetical protein